MRSPSLGIVLLLGCVAPVLAQQPEWTDLKATRQVDGVRAIDAHITYAAGELELFRADRGLLYDVDLRYDAARLRPVRTWTVDGEVGRFELRFESSDLEDADWDLEEGEFGRLELGLSGDVPTELELEVGAAEANLELGGVPLTGFVYRTGASSSDISFDEPNPVRMKRMELAAGAAEFDAVGLGNARFEQFEFQGAVGDVSLDFTGAWDGDAVADISVGLGALQLVLPRQIGVRLEKKGFLAGFDPSGLERVDGGWQSENWETATHRLRIRLKAAFGSVDVTFAS